MNYRKMWYKEFAELCALNHVSVEEHFTGVFIDNGIDKWVVEIRSENNERLVDVVINHRNLLNKTSKRANKKGWGTCKIPDYHIQTRGRFSPLKAFQIIMGHENKWNDKRRDIIMSNRQKEKEALINLREKLIGDLHTLPFTVYTDEQLETLLDTCPQSIEELVQVKGFPAEGKRVKGFGEAIVKIFTGLDEVKDIDVREVNGNLEVVMELKNMGLF